MESCNVDCQAWFSWRMVGSGKRKLAQVQLEREATDS